MASAPDWDAISDKVEELAQEEFGMDVEDFVQLVCRYRQLIRLLLNLCGD